MARKLIRSRDTVFLKDQIVSDAAKNDKSQSSLEIPITPPVVHNDHEEVREDNNDGPI